MDIINLNHQESSYQEILQQAVALIESARNKVAHAVIINSNEMHWKIGKLLYEKKLESKHGDSVVKRLSEDLKNKMIINKTPQKEINKSRNKKWHNDLISSL